MITGEEIKNAFYVLTQLCANDASAEELTPHAEMVAGDLRRLPYAERQSTIVALGVSAAAEGDAGARACAIVGIPIPEGKDALLQSLGTLADDIFTRLRELSGPDRDAALATLLGYMAQMEPTMAERYRKLLIDKQLARAPFIDDELKRRRNGQEAEEVKLPRKIGARLPSDVAEAVKEIAPPAPDPGLIWEIETALSEREPDGRRLLSGTVRRKKAGMLMLAWLAQHGGFVQSSTGELYYFYEDERRLFDLSTDRWAAWLYSLTGANPAGSDYAHLLADCKTAALYAPVREIVRVSYWDDDARVLRVSRFDGTVHVLDGENITEEPNGQFVIFDDAPEWEPYAPDFETPGALDWLSELPNWQKSRRGEESKAAAYSLGLRTWVLTTFFPELCPSRPHAVFLGEKGSGKSMAWRLLLKLLFGQAGELSGVPDKPDGFTAAASVAHILVLDNLDQFTGWLRDKLARIATGAVDHYRKLYTSNEQGRVTYRCWLGFTARTPNTLRRDDLADRLLLLPVDRLDDDQRENEIVLLGQAAAWRGDFWGDVLTRLNTAVAAIRAGELSTRSKLRMADWETLGRLLATCEGSAALWDELVIEIQRAQNDFLLEEDLIVEGLELWLQSESNHGREVPSRELYDELTFLLFEDKKPPRDWPKSVRGFGMRLASIRRELRAVFKVDWGPGTGATRNVPVYQFWPKDEK